MATILDLSRIQVDPQLLERTPLGLCQYHQVLPLAREGSRVSVAMVYPHNSAALSMLGELLDAQIVPVQVDAVALQAALDKLAPTSSDAPPVLLHATGAGDTSLLVRLATIVATAEGADCVRLDSPEVGASAILTAAGATRARLTALPLPGSEECHEIALRAPTSVLLASTDDQRLEHMLVVVRGLGADLRALAWAAAIAAAGQVRMTLLVLGRGAHLDLHELLDESTESGRHLADSLRALAAAGIEPSLRIRQGEPQRQIADELAARRYDMLVLSAESRGEFVAAALEQADLSGASLAALLICKPNRISSPLRQIQSNKRRLHRD